MPNLGMSLFYKTVQNKYYLHVHNCRWNQNNGFLLPTVEIGENVEKKKNISETGATYSKILSIHVQYPPIVTHCILIQTVR